MASPSNSHGSIQSLSVGNVVTAGFRLYGANFKQYIRIALIGTLWGLLWFVALVLAIIFSVASRNYHIPWWLSVPVLIGVCLYPIAKYLANSALIARLAFGELTNQPETVGEARRYIKARMWSFLGTGLLLWFINTVILIAFFLVLALVVVGFLNFAGGSQFLQNPSPAMFPAYASIFGRAGLLALVLILAFLGFLLLFHARLVATELPLAIEPKVTAISTIGRMWSLTEGNGWRIALILFVTLLITLPILILVRLLSGTGSTTIPTSKLAAYSSNYFLRSAFISFVLNFTLSTVMLPLWQAIKAVIYYDLRSRREGLGLQLRDRGAQS
ncbi:MAG: hypothetical protein KME45_18830 [Stenomitos rutilans HA7619-LM2]|jgi:hypothetical protein|nr:hypothetical protein [Stenomitos rutilans HA7619-LM2]